MQSCVESAEVSVSTDDVVQNPIWNHENVDQSKR
jgi:hypothetical protein